MENQEKNKIFVTSDWHFNHPGILHMERTRFTSIEEHNEFIISRYNKTVGEDDVCYVLGDVGFAPLEELKPIIRSLHGKKILIKGNHDRFNKGQALDLGFAEYYDHPVYYNSKIILSHEPVREAFNNPYVVNIHGHLHGARLAYPNFVNVNVSSTDYLPLDLEVLSNKVLKGKFGGIPKNRRETFGKEWYASGYVWTCE